MSARAVFVCLLVYCSLPWIPNSTALTQSEQETDSEVLFYNPNMTFYIYPTPDSRGSPVVNDETALLPAQPLTIVTHGFRGDHTAQSVQCIVEALQLSGVSNVVAVDWSPLADAANHTALGSYHRVRDSGVTAAADLLSTWLQQVMRLKDILPEQVHAIGFSLGAHLVGVLGHNFNSSLGRLYGLDPPKFGYEHIPAEDRLDASDARFVNVIHTTAGVLGYSEPIGHVDFFPNGDVIPQHGCPRDSPIDIITCSHYFSFVVFAETVFYQGAFVGTQCGSWGAYTRSECDQNTTAVMGYHTPNTTRGVFYAKTADAPPFGQEDPENPLPAELKALEVYNETGGVIHASDVVKFLMHKEPKDLPAESQQGPDTKVMKVQSRQRATTPDPPAFVNNAQLSHRTDYLLLTLASLYFLRLFLYEVFGH